MLELKTLANNKLYGKSYTHENSGDGCLQPGLGVPSTTADF